MGRKTGASLKPATPLDTGHATQTTITRRVIPGIASDDQKTPDLWEYLRSLSASDWPRHIVYGYRTEPSPKVPIFKSGEAYVQMPNGQRVSLTDEQEVEFALLQNYGGGVFRLLVKRGPQIVCAGNLAINAPARAITIPVDPAQPTGSGNSAITMTDASATAQVAGRAMDALTFQERQSAEIGFRAMETAANVMQRFGKQEGAPQDDLMRQAMQVMIARMLAPPPDPLELLSKLLALQAQLNPQSQPNELMATVMKSAVEKLLNPAPSGAPVSWTAEAVRSAPAFINGVAEFMREQRMISDNQVKLTEMQRAGVPIAQPPMPNPQVIPPAMPAPTNGAPPGVPSMEFVEGRILEIFQRPVSAEQAADDALAFLDGLDTNATISLANLGETGLLGFFQSRPILKPACANMSRLVEFIRAFLKMHAEDVAQNKAVDVAAQSKPAPLTN